MIGCGQGKRKPTGGGAADEEAGEGLLGVLELLHEAPGLRRLLEELRTGPEALTAGDVPAVQREEGP